MLTECSDTFKETVAAAPPDPAVVMPIAHRDASLIEDQRRLTPEVAASLTKAGFARHFVPQAWGGSAGKFGQLLDAAATLAETCASTAWCATLFAAHGRLAAYLPVEGQCEVWGVSPDTRIAASIVPPQGEATTVGAGWRLSGSWVYASGGDHSDWILLASWTRRGDDREHRIFAVPRAEVTVEDTWYTLGLRGTGSNTVKAEEVLVPAHRSFTLDRLMWPQPDAARCHSVPYPMVAALLFAAPILGAARAAQSAWLAVTASREQADGRPGRLSHKVQHALGRSSAEIRAAELLLKHVAHQADTAPVTPLGVAENRRDASMAAAMCSKSVDRLFRACGARGLAEQSPLQRRWRDVTAAAQHAALDFEAAATAYAQSEFAQCTA